MRHSRIKYCKSNESISFEKMIFSPRGKCAFFALKIISIFLILLLTFISWTSCVKSKNSHSLGNYHKPAVGTGIFTGRKRDELIAMLGVYPCVI